jgi:hypothetical protein
MKRCHPIFLSAYFLKTLIEEIRGLSSAIHSRWSHGKTILDTLACHPVIIKE